MRNLLLLISLFFSLSLFSQEIGRFSLYIDERYIDAPVSVPLNHFNYNADAGEIALYEIMGSEEKLVPSQIETGRTMSLCFILDGLSRKKTTREFVIRLNHQNLLENPDHLIYMNKSDGNLTFYSGKFPILSYRFETMSPPKGVDPLYERSGFIHPLYSPGGEVLTRVQAPDHYHHYGIWGPWTLTHIDGREVDFWNLAKGQGTVRFNTFLSKTSGKVFSGFKVLQQHIDFGNKGKDQVALNEVLEVRIWNVGRKVWLVDYTTTFNSPLPNGIVFDAYRYGGGIGFRATEKWTKDNSSVLTSEGKTRNEADGSRARWCIVEGEADVVEKKAGILFMSHPFNRQYPEPMRVWPENANGNRGDIYFEFVPIRYEPWTIKPFQDYTLSYRLIVFDGEMNKETAEAYWNSFATTPKVQIEYNK